MRRPRLLLLAGLFFLVAGVRQAASVPILPPDLSELADIINQTRPWLFIGTGAPDDSTTPEHVFNKGVGDAVDISNFEIGAIKAPIPANQSGDDWGPDLAFGSNVADIPGVNIGVPGFGLTGTLPDGNEICWDGNVAVTHLDADDADGDLADNGTFHVSDIGVFAKNVSDGGKIPDGLPTGIVTAGPANTDTSNGGTIAGNSNSMFNDADYPNPSDSPTTTVFGVPSEDILGPGNGITGDWDFESLRKALDTALDGSTGFPGGIPGLPGSAPAFARLQIDNHPTEYTDVLDGHVIDLATNVADDGQIKGDDVETPTNLYVKLKSGLNVIDFFTGGNDLLLDNGNIIVDGPRDALGIFRVPTDSKFNISNGNVLIGPSGIQRCNVIFFSDRPEESTVFSFDNTLFYGISFWTLGDASGSHINNSQGCVQFIGDKLNFQDIRYCRCCEGTVEVIPEPCTLALLGIGASCLLGQVWHRRRKRPSPGN